MTEKNQRDDPLLSTSISQGTNSYHDKPPGLTITLQNSQLQGKKDSHNICNEATMIDWTGKNCK